MKKAVFTTNPITGVEYYHGILDVEPAITTDMVLRYCVAWDGEKDAKQIAEWLMDESLWQENDAETFAGWEPEDYQRLAKMIADKA